MGRAGSQRRQWMRSVAGHGAETEPGAQPQDAENEPEPEPSCHEFHDPLNTYQEEPLTMRQWMRWQNCKTYQVTNTAETYPSIKPTIDRCNPAKTLEHIDDSMEANQCGRIFQMGKDDVLDVWNQSPRKETLFWYGIGGQCNAYSKAVAKSLKAAGPQSKKPVKTAWPTPPLLKVKVEEPRGGYILDRECLKAKLDKMPNVRSHLKATSALNWLHCPPPADPEHPFVKEEVTLPKFSFEESKEKSPKHGLRRKHWYCPRQCETTPGGVENKCLVHEKHLLGTQRAPDDDEACPEEAAAAAQEPEPRNYEELYKSLEGCFVQGFANEACEAYELCCRDPEDPPTQGCNEFTPEGAGGGGKLDDNNDDSDLVGKGKGGDGDDDDDGDGKGKGKGGGKGDGKGGKHGSGSDAQGDGKGGDKDGKGAGKGDGEGDGTGDGKGGGKGDGKGDGQGDGDGGDGDGDGKGGGKGGGGKDGKGDSGQKGPKYSDDTSGKINPVEEPSTRDHTKVESSSDEQHVDMTKTEPTKPGGDSGGKRRRKKKKSSKRGDADKYKKKDCPCEICCQVAKQEDTPLIKEMRQRDKEREIRDYLRQMRHRQYLECREVQHNAPQNKCQDIACSTWCTPRMETHLGRVQAVQQLQTELQRDWELKCISQDLDCLLSTLCRRLARNSSWR